MKRKTISFYGNFGAGNLGNECTLEAAIEQTLQCWPNARLSCFCTDPSDVRTRHNIEAFPSEAIDRTAVHRNASYRRGRLARILRIAFQRLPLELMHWVKSLRVLGRTDMLIVAGTGIVADYMTGPLGWPYDIFKLSTLAALCRTRLIFLSVGVGPIHHPLSRWFLKKSLALADFRSYRDAASRQYLEKIGFNTDRDIVCPDVVFGLSPSNRSPAQGVQKQKRVVGVGLKDYGTSERVEPTAFREYLDTMAEFVSWLHGRGYSVRLLIGDFQFDRRVIDEFIAILKCRNISICRPFLLAEPALTVKELLSQINETEIVVSPRYHNLVLALIQGKPVITLSDHPKLESLAGDFGLGDYHLPLRMLNPGDLIGRFEHLEMNVERLRPHIAAKLENYRHALCAQCAMLAATTS